MNGGKIEYENDTSPWKFSLLELSLKKKTSLQSNILKMVLNFKVQEFAYQVAQEIQGGAVTCLTI